MHLVPRTGWSKLFRPIASCSFFDIPDLTVDGSSVVDECVPPLGKRRTVNLTVFFALSIFEHDVDILVVPCDSLSHRLRCDKVLMNLTKGFEPDRESSRTTDIPLCWQSRLIIRSETQSAAASSLLRGVIGSSCTTIAVLFRLRLLRLEPPQALRGISPVP